MEIVIYCYLGILGVIFIPIILCSVYVNYYPKGMFSKFIKKHIVTNEDLDPPAQL